MKKRWLSIFLATVMFCGTCFADISTAWAGEPASIRQEAGDEAETELENEPMTEADTEPENEPMTEADTELEGEPGTEADTELKSEPGTEADTEQESKSEAPAELQTEPEAESAKAAPEWTANPYGKQLMTELQKTGTLTLSEGMNVTMKADEKAAGLMISGSGSQYAAGRFTLASGFRFDRNAVGRLEVDGLAPKGTAVSIAFYLDDETEPFATIALGTQKKAGKWTYEGDRTADVLAKQIKGEHRVSFQILTENTEEFTFLLRSIEFVESSLPVIYVDIDESQGTILAMNQDPEHETECYGNMTVQVPEGYVSEYAPDQIFTTQTYEMEYIRGRGNSTWSCDKKPYKIKLSKKADLFGMGKNKHWVLLANRYDNSLLRNKATYWLGKELGMPFTPECVFVDVVMNGVYCGSYYLSEQVRVGSSRVDIDDLEDNEETMHATEEPLITGGYLLSMFPYGDEEKLSFQTTRENEFLIESPSFEDYKNDAQYNYIKNYVQKTEDAIYGDNFRTADGVPYGDLMDIDSAIDYYWIQEISMNGDAFLSTSTYLYKLRNGKLYWGPLWDFDFVAWGDTDYSEEPDVYGFVQKENTWFARLFEDKAFAEKLAARWPAMREKLMELSKDGGQLDKYYEELTISQRYDFEKWGAYNFYWGEEEEGSTALTFRQEADRFKTWIRKRVAWIDENVSSLVPVECTITYLSDGKVYSTQKAISGKMLSGLPKEPAKKGYVFAGWYGEEYGEEFQVTDGYWVSGNLTVNAKWVLKKDVKQVQKLYFQTNSVYVPIYEEGYNMNYTVMPLDATLLDVTWKSSNEKIATVDASGYVSFRQTGNVKITGTCRNGVSASYWLHIVDDENLQYPYTVTLNRTSLKLEAGKWAKLTPKLEEPESCTGTFQWYSSNPDIADITDTGVVLANKAGTATIVVYSMMAGTFANCEVTVTKPVEKGEIYTVSGLKYQVTKVGTGGTVTCVGRAKSSLKKVKIPTSVKIKGKRYKVTAVGKNAFKSKNITSITLGSNIRTIGEGAFRNCKNITRVNIPKNVTKIGKNAFYGCKKLSVITIRATKLSRIGSGAWKGIKSTARFNVPSKKVKAYKKLLRTSTGYQKKTMRIEKV